MRAIGIAFILTGCIDWSSLYGSVCGNALVEAGEQCDDGNRDDTDACPSSCQWAHCGDGFVRKNVEECDAADTADCTDGCLACTVADSTFWPDYGACYRFMTEQKSWNEASHACAEHAGNLVEYTADYFEANRVRDGLLNRFSDPTWIGLHRDDKTEAFMWVNGGSLRREFWQAGQPEPRPNDCVLQGSGLSWSAELCDDAHAYICKRTPPLIRKEHNHAYRLIHDPITWQNARDTCIKLGGYLASIDDEAEQAFLTSHIIAETWIGASDMDRDQIYNWTSGEPLTYSAFAPWDGDDGTNACVLIGANSYWFNRRCSDKHIFACEFE